MHCYASEALRLQLYSDTRLVLAEIDYDPLVIDEVLDDAGIADFGQYLALDPGRRMELVRRVNLLSPRAARDCVA